MKKMKNGRLTRMIRRFDGDDIDGFFFPWKAMLGLLPYDP